MSDTTFGSLLRVHRLAVGLSIRAFAHQLGISAPYLGDVEAGRRRAFPPARVASVVAALGLKGEQADELVAAAATERVTSLTPKEMIENVVDRLGRAKTRQLVEQICAERMQE
jgi:transcriptional regulator with XRE-family HTH domain